jgi:hypothetical protein
VSARPPSWDERAAYMRVIGELQRELGRELDRAQPGALPGDALPGLLERVAQARDRYLADVRMAEIDGNTDALLAAIGRTEGTMEP